MTSTSTLTTSVVMTTCEGARWVAEQLGSILGQDHPVDEIIVCDDASTDDTVAEVQRLAATATIPVRVTVNPERMGTTANVASGLRQATSDIVFLADHDDIWHPKKVATQLAVFTADPTVAAVFSDAHIVDADGRSHGDTLWDRVGFRSARIHAWHHDPFSVLLHGEVVTGATLALRRDAALDALPFSQHRFHDSWLALILAARSQRIVALDDQLLSYRTHDANQAGVAPDELGERLARRDAHLRNLRTISAQWADAATLLGRSTPALSARVDQLTTHGNFYDRRAHLPARRAARARFVLGSWATGRYGQGRAAARAAAYDLLARDTG